MNINCCQPGPIGLRAIKEDFLNFLVHPGNLIGPDCSSYPEPGFLKVQHDS